jgi:hypothetical protein
MKFTAIRKAFGNYFLKNEAAQLSRNKAAFNMAEAKTFAILFEASNIDNIELVKKYANYLKEMKKKIRVIGFFNTPFPPDITYSKLEYEFFSVKELNWFMAPSGSFLKNFLEEEFDVLIDLNLSDEFPLKYISSLSKARFKVGKFNEENKKVHDLLIDYETDKTFKFFLRQVDIYLDMINKKTAV